MEIDFWTSASVTKARKLDNGDWDVTVSRGDMERILKPKHVVFALGFGDGTPYMPKINDMVSIHCQVTLGY